MIDYENLQKLNAPFFNEYETAFKEVMQSGWYVLGKKVEEFENAYSSYCNVKHTIGVANGLDALTLSLKAFKFEKGSEVLVPSNTYIATILSIVQNDLKPILVEPCIETYNIDPAKLEAVLNFLDGKEMVTGPELAAGVGYEGKTPRIYPIFSALIDRGALTVTAEEEEVEVPETPENEDVEDVLQIDTETTTSDEPEIQSTEKIDVSMDPVTRTASTFTVENADLISSIINSFKDSRARINMKEADDLDARGFIKAMQKSKETSADRLDKKIDQLVDKMSEFDEETQAKILKILNFKFKSVDANSLTKMISNKLGKEAPSVDVQVNADEIDFEAMLAADSAPPAAKQQQQQQHQTAPSNSSIKQGRSGGTWG